MILTDKRTVLIRDPKRSIVIEDKTLGIQADAGVAFLARARAEAVARVGCGRNARETGKIQDTSGVNSGQRLAGGIREEDGVLIREDEVGGGIGGRDVGLLGMGVKSDGELVETGLVVEGTLGIPVATH